MQCYKLHRKIRKPKQSSNKLTPTKSSLKKNEDFVYRILLDEKESIKLDYEVEDSVRTGSRKIFFPKMILQVGVVSCIQ